MAKQVLKVLESALAEAFAFGGRVEWAKKQVQDGINVLESDATPGRKKEIIQARKDYDHLVMELVQTAKRNYESVDSVQVAVGEVHEKLDSLKVMMDRYRRAMR